MGLHLCLRFIVHVGYDNSPVSTRNSSVYGLGASGVEPIPYRLDLYLTALILPRARARGNYSVGFGASVPLLPPT